MLVGNFLGSRKARNTMAAIVALGVVQVPLMSWADSPAPWVQKADQQKKKKKKKAARKAPRRTVRQSQTVTRAPEVPQVAEAPVPEPVTPAPVPEVPAPVTPPPAPVTPPPAAIPAAAATGGGMNLIFPILGLLGLGGLVAAVGGSSNG